MTAFENNKTQLLDLERQIKALCNKQDSIDPYIQVRGLSREKKQQLKDLFAKRCFLLDRMLLCNQAEQDRIQAVNSRLYDLTQKLYAKTYSLYTSILKTGYDPDFDDDIMIEGSLRFVADDESSFLPMSHERIYGSDFNHIMSIIYALEEDPTTFGKACAKTFASYNPQHSPDMTPQQLGLDNSLDDGISWDHANMFPGTIICHAIYELNNLFHYSYIDIMRMNDFWCEVKITHQHLTDLEGNRYSCIDNRENQK